MARDKAKVRFVYMEGEGSADRLLEEILGRSLFLENPSLDDARPATLPDQREEPGR